jgi:hypothetical protein
MRSVAALAATAWPAQLRSVRETRNFVFVGVFYTTFME